MISTHAHKDAHKEFLLRCANFLPVSVRLNRKSLSSVMKYILHFQIENMILQGNVNKNAEGGLSFKFAV